MEASDQFVSSQDEEGVENECESSRLSRIFGILCTMSKTRIWVVIFMFVFITIECYKICIHTGEMNSFDRVMRTVTRMACATVKDPSSPLNMLCDSYKEYIGMKNETIIGHVV
jgi:hypothetical protein